MNHEQPTLFETDPPEKAPEPVEPNYEAMAATGDRRNANYDPNEREISRAREQGIGAGIAAAQAGELKQQSEKQTPQARHYEMPGIGTGRQNSYNQPVSVGEMKEAKAGMTADEIDRQSILNKTKAAEIKHMIARRNTHGRGPGR